MSTYSFQSVQAVLAGPGGSVVLGNSAGPAEEGISVEMKEEKNLQVAGADGQVMNSLRASNLGRLTIRLLKTAPANAILSALYNFQRSSPSLWGQNTLIVTDVDRGDVITGSQIAFTRQANLTYAKDAGMNEWIFEGNLDELLGAGVPNVNV